MMKRLIDIIVSGILLVIAMPLLLVTAIAIFVREGRPIFFQQERIGLSGRTFSILKFRTMRLDPIFEDNLITIGADARITRIGHFLRQTKIDELPQLLNVLMGDMSLIGPRPEVAAYVALYPPELRKIIQTVRPGISDNASIKYRNEAELLSQKDNPSDFYTSVILPDKIRMAADYANHNSILGDLKIAMMTVFSVLFGK